MCPRLPEQIKYSNVSTDSHCEHLNCSNLNKKLIRPVDFQIWSLCMNIIHITLLTGFHLKFLESLWNSKSQIKFNVLLKSMEEINHERNVSFNTCTNFWSFYFLNPNIENYFSTVILFISGLVCLSCDRIPYSNLQFYTKTSQRDSFIDFYMHSAYGSKLPSHDQFLAHHVLIHI